MFPGTHIEHLGQKPAIVLAESGHTVTYVELDERSRRLARVLYDAGLRRGDHVAVLSDNDPAVFEVYWAAMRSGLYVTPVNWHLAASEVSHILFDSGARGLVASGSLAELARSAIAANPGVQVCLAFNGDIDGFTAYRDALAAASTEPLPAQPRGADMLYSSGTTGRPKGIKPPLPDFQIDEAPDPMTGVFAALYGFDEKTVYLSPAPLYHAAPLRFGAAVHALGGTVVVMERFDAEPALAVIERYRITHSQWVPTMFIRLLKLPEEVRTRYDVGSQKVAVHAAAPCPTEVKRAMIQWWGPIVYEYYSSTEGNGLTTITSAEWLDKPGSVGRAVLGTPKICDEQGAELRSGETGIVYFARDQLPFEYHGDAHRTASVTHPSHPAWTTTGDVGHLDEDGYLFLTDRRDFMIISGGVNIYPQEIENALALHPKIVDAAVIGVPDAEMGQSVHAIVIPVPDITADDELAKEIREYLRDQIAGYKVPRTVAFTTELPRTPTGKLIKSALICSDKQEVSSS